MNAYQCDTLPAKLARLLLELSDYGATNKLDISLQTLADKLDVYRETVGALLCDFRKRQWVDMRYRELTILQIASLLALTGHEKGEPLARQG